MTGVGAGDSDTSESAPFELPALAATWQGAVALRPAALFGRPDMKAVREKINHLMQSENGPRPIGNFHIEDIAQVVFRITFHTSPNAEGPQTALLTDLVTNPAGRAQFGPGPDNGPALDTVLFVGALPAGTERSRLGDRFIHSQIDGFRQLGLVRRGQWNQYPLGTSGARDLLAGRVVWRFEDPHTGWAGEANHTANRVQLLRCRLADGRRRR